MVQGKKVLLVDDEEELVRAVSIRLRAAGYEVVTAGDGEEGLMKARSASPDLIILDLMMPKRDGYSVCRILKFDNNFKNIPILMLTARGQDKDKQMGTDLGADGYITKPFESEALLSAVKGFLNK
ncbi:MAG: hypothetical protein AUJ75_04600 [Candidatus Omnitrophica bacterium CG1_02_49_10]|nr:MAG: hypothetical protein AUJ75_04600 [Candidatus Omnitrophica bacterium CG1_02_49_10]